jgi:phage terminase large subunit-like protein
MTLIDKSKLYIKYAYDVVEGREVAGKLIRLACQRFLDWFKRDDIEFNYDDVDAKIRFISKFKLTESPFTGQPFNLLPYQQWIFANIFGFYYTGTDDRVISNVLLLMSRKQGKTQLAAAILLAAIVMDKQMSVAGYTIANSSEQAGLAFKAISDLCSSVDPKQKVFQRGKARVVKNIEIPSIKSRIRVLSSDTSKLDGLNPQIFIQDEGHAAKTDDIWGVMITGQDARHNPLAISISTAGFLVGDDFPLYAQWHACKNILEGAVEDDSWFMALYQLDDGDDWKDKSNWPKACPSIGITTPWSKIEKKFNNVMSNPSMEVQFKTKQLNMWCQSAETWIPYEKINEVSQKFDYDIFDSSQEYSILGVDLAERSDLCVVSTLINHNNKVYLKAHPFICQTAYNNSPNKELYRQWVKNGYLTLVPTDSIDIDWVIKLVQDLNDKIPVALVAYDPWASQQFKIAAEKQGLPMHACKQGLGSFSEPTSMLEHMILTKEVVIDYNPVTNFCFANVLIKTDENSNRKPVKSSKNQKIDIVIAFIQSIKLYMELTGILDYTDLKAVALN